MSTTSEDTPTSQKMRGERGREGEGKGRGGEGKGRGGGEGEEGGEGRGRRRGRVTLTWSLIWMVMSGASQCTPPMDFVSERGERGEEERGGGRGEGRGILLWFVSKGNRVCSIPCDPSSSSCWLEFLYFYFLHKLLISSLLSPLSSLLSPLSPLPRLRMSEWMWHVCW